MNYFSHKRRCTKIEIESADNLPLQLDRIRQSYVLRVHEQLLSADQERRPAVHRRKYLSVRERKAL